MKQYMEDSKYIPNIGHPDKLKNIQRLERVAVSEKKKLLGNFSTGITALIAATDDYLNSTTLDFKPSHSHPINDRYLLR